ncbi:hypothetical protein [Salinibacter ruber]|nr:hypothetical protein [Salinibacter ruber]MCS4137107.1 hypothetical protein [Salinibacter ruber]MCS4197688.1 hypothetical protein [Salinibacter ruber]
MPAKGSNPVVSGRVSSTTTVAESAAALVSGARRRYTSSKANGYVR